MNTHKQTTNLVQERNTDREGANTRGDRQEISGTIVREFIRCADETGKIGSFLATNSRRRVSPTFNSLADLYTWANENDWLPEGGVRVYRPRGEAIENYMMQKYPNLI